MGENKTRHILNKAVDVITSMPLFTKLIYIYIYIYVGKKLVSSINFIFARKSATWLASH